MGTKPLSPTEAPGPRAGLALDLLPPATSQAAVPTGLLCVGQTGRWRQRPSEKEKDSWALALLTATVRDSRSYRGLFTVVFGQHAGAPTRPSAFCLFVFFWNVPRTARIPELMGDH